jgi:hypothetical protein
MKAEPETLLTAACNGIWEFNIVYAMPPQSLLNHQTPYMVFELVKTFGNLEKVLNVTALSQLCLLGAKRPSTHTTINRRGFMSTHYSSAHITYLAYLHKEFFEG